MSLPLSTSLNIAPLASAFNSTSATYKFYWLLSIIESVEEGKSNIEKRELFAKMLANSWYTVNYFHISFGNQDLIQQAIKTIATAEAIPINIRKDQLMNVLLTGQNRETISLLRHFDKNVPHWFLTPWICKSKGENYTQYRNRIYRESQRFHNQVLYALHADHIEINPIWMDYVKNNARILKDYCYWNLSNFLQVRNPNVSDIPGKLIKPPFRGSLVNQRKNYWDIVFKELGTVQCIYTDSKLSITKYALDHFVPHAFVSHDLIWNLAPIDVIYNSIKSDKLPIMDLHFDKFYNLQKTAFEIVSEVSPKSKLLEEYVYLFNKQQSEPKFNYDQLKDAISPLISIAANNGFQFYTD
ncbi:HNH endonuclease domain-containing protein [Flavobacterium sp. UBA4197]|uniref:HNH endonuclease domain-containing protein n=1 Tax=Flavobacterium sp. UBA4197 TaxID=1946546 RepID=UPI002580EECB|nr:HNH endonuclease domain-containing protein [Flavobacterium sp. UBA4197]